MRKLFFFDTKQNLFLTLLLFVNILFVLKYAVRIEIVPIYIFVFLYILFFIATFFTLYKYQTFFNNLKKFRTIFLSFSFIVFLCLCYLNNNIDGLSLNIDRWSALEILIKNTLNLNYPYADLDHLGNTTSNLPGLFYIGLPFYFLGDVGFLQPFIFLLISIYITFTKINNTQKVFVLLLLLVSPSYYWEVVAKSDLMSNLFIIVLFISLWNQNQKGSLFKKKILLAFFVAVFILTRGIVAIPFIIFLFSDFIKNSLKIKLSFIVFLLFFILLVCLPILVALPNLEFILLHNPFNHQTKYAPQILIIASLLLPFYFSFRVKLNSDVFLFSTIIIGGLMIITFILNCIEEGFIQNIYGNLFDISYMSMVVPFIVFYFLESFKFNLLNSNKNVK